MYNRTSHNGTGRSTGTDNALGFIPGIAYLPCGVNESTASNIGDTTLFDHLGKPTQTTHQGRKRNLFILCKMVKDITLV
jgi:hypothetical protein